MRILTTKDVGYLIKTVRKKSKLTQVALAGACGVGERFIRELEAEKPTCQFQKALLVLQMLGIKLNAVVPQDALNEEDL
ncbi:MAG: transcriptional regulator [Gammaproteobacteria bacterium]